MHTRRYPTLKVFKGKEVIDYEDAKIASDIVDYMADVADSNWAPPVDVVVPLTPANFDQYVSSGDALFLCPQRVSRGRPKGEEEAVEEGKGGTSLGVKQFVCNTACAMIHACAIEAPLY